MQTVVEMDTAFSLDTVIQEQLIERRHRLEEAVAISGKERNVIFLVSCLRAVARNDAPELPKETKFCKLPFACTYSAGAVEYK